MRDETALIMHVVFPNQTRITLDTRVSSVDTVITVVSMFAKLYIAVDPLTPCFLQLCS